MRPRYGNDPHAVYLNPERDPDEAYDRHVQEMIDYAPKGWLRRPRLKQRLLEFMRHAAILALILFALAAILQAIDAHAAQHWTVLLPDERYPATLDEGQAARPDLGRPLYCISHQERSNEPWNHRFCTYEHK